MHSGVLGVAAAIFLHAPTLMGLLWGDRGQAQAQASLRMSLSEIRAGFSQAAPDALAADRDEVGLKPDLVTVDCLDMLRLVTERSTLPSDALRWSGDLLTNLDGVSPQFDEWLFFARTKIRGQFCAGLESKMREALAQPELPLAAILAEGILGVDPTSEVAHRVLIKHHANMGNIGTPLFGNTKFSARRSRACWMRRPHGRPRS